VRRLSVRLLLGMLIVTTACGGGGSAMSQTAPLSGNWQITLSRHVNPIPPLTFTGFLIQSGTSVTGNLILGSNCSGVGPLTGTVDGQNVSLTINEFGEDISLMGTMPSSNSPMSGEFSNLAGGCTAYPNTGTWSAVQVAPLTGSFHGTFVSATPANGTLDVTGTLAQGPNTGSSTATLTGTIAASGAARFCSYLSTATITGIISGTAVSLNLFGPDGSLISQIGQIGQIGNPAASQATVTTDGTSLIGSYLFPTISTNCPEDQGTFQITFP
jgi:hypothetical protein